MAISISNSMNIDVNEAQVIVDNAAQSAKEEERENILGSMFQSAPGEDETVVINGKVYGAKEESLKDPSVVSGDDDNEGVQSGGQAQLRDPNEGNEGVG